MIVPCYYIISFGCLMDFIIYFYIIFGTNLLTQGPVQIAVFCLPISVFHRKEYQTESKRNETFGRVIFGTIATQKTWSTRQEANEAATRAGGAPPRSWAPYYFPDVPLEPIYSYVP